MFLDANLSYRNAYCDSCKGRIGGARLFCLDCVHKTDASFGDLDLCCEPQCVAARVTYRDDLEGAHEPEHRLVKARAPVLDRHYGRVYSAACGAFERLEDTCARIAEYSGHPLAQEEEGSRPDEQRDSYHEPAVGEIPAEIDKIDDTLTTQGSTGDGVEARKDPPQDPTRVQDQEGNLPTCGNCNGRLSFPCWYCIFCKGEFQS